MSYPSIDPSAGGVADTLVLANGSVVPGNFLPGDSSGPNAVVYDSANGNLYATDGSSNDVAVINATLGDVIARVSVDPYVYPEAIAYDGSNGYIYVVDNGVYPLPFDLGCKFDPSCNNAPSTVTVINGATNTVTATIPVGKGADSVAYDPENGYVYVANWESTNVTVINGATDRVVGSFSSGESTPNGVAYDARNGYLYLLDQGCSPACLEGDGNLEAIDTSTDAAIASVTVGELPSAVTYDSASGYLYVANYWTDNLTVVDGVTNSVVESVVLGGYGSLSLTYDAADQCVYVPDLDGNVSVVSTATDSVVSVVPAGINSEGIGYDSANGYLYVANSGSNNMTVINGSTNSVTGSILVGTYPEGMAYDPSNNDVYVANPDSDQVAVVNATTGALIGWVSAGYFPVAATYDPVNGYLYVVDMSCPILGACLFGPANSTVIDPRTNTVVGEVPTDLSPVAAAVDTATGDVYVACESTNHVTVINGTTDTDVAEIPVGSEPAGIAYDRGNGNIYVTDSGSHTVTVINGTTQTVVGSIQVGSGPDAVAYDNASGYLYVANGADGSVTVINGATNTVVGPVISVGQAPSAVAFDRANKFVYVTDEGSNNVTVIYAPTGSVVGSVPVGKWPDGVAYDSRDGRVLVTNMGSGSVSLLEPVHPVVFAETGLPAGRPWSVILGGALGTHTTETVNTSTSSATFGVPWGSTTCSEVYGYWIRGPSGYAVQGISPTGYLQPGCSGMTVLFSFARGSTYTLTLAERGLRSGATWCAWFAVPSPLCTQRSSLSIQNLTPARYTLVILGVPAGYNVSVMWGRVPIGSGVGVQMGLVVHQAMTLVLTYTYPVNLTFLETGLPGGTNWCVQVGTSSRCGTGTTLVFSVANGTYSYRVGAVTGYVSTTSGLARAKVLGPTTELVRFAARHHAPTLYAPSEPLSKEARPSTLA